MFWNNNNTKSPTTSPLPPGQRRNSETTSSTTFVAPAIRGSIRPPSLQQGQQQHTRQEHLESYLNDETLKRSTRKVSYGMYMYFNIVSFTFLLLISFFVDFFIVILHSCFFFLPP